MLKKTFRLSGREKIESGEKINTRFFTLRFVTNKLKHPRFLFVVSKRVDKRAVTRNKVKRNLSRILEKNIPNEGFGYDIAIVAKKEALNITQKEIEKELLGAIEKIK